MATRGRLNTPEETVGENCQWWIWPIGDVRQGVIQEDGDARDDLVLISAFRKL